MNNNNNNSNTPKDEGKVSFMARLTKISDISAQHSFTTRTTTDSRKGAADPITEAGVTPPSSLHRSRSTGSVKSVKAALTRDDFLVFELYLEKEEDEYDEAITEGKDQAINYMAKIEPNYTILYHNWTLRELYRHVVSSISIKVTNNRNLGVSNSPKKLDDDDESAAAAATNRQHRTKNSSLLSTTGGNTKQRHHSHRHHHRHNSSTRRGDGDRHNAKLGSNLHPRDMRRLVTPFSASNEPELIIRRHVIVVNFDPLRAIITRNRILVLVPSGADSVLKKLEDKITGHRSITDEYYYDNDHDNDMEQQQKQQQQQQQTVDTGDDDGGVASGGEYDESNTTNETYDTYNNDDDDWSSFATDGIDEKEEFTFELLCVNACLATVHEMLADDTREIQEKGLNFVQKKILDGKDGDVRTEDALVIVRNLKNAVRAMQARVKGYVNSVQRVLNEDEDMALMNVSRLVTHPQNFIQPISAELLEIESDNPELVLESNLQSVMSLSNALELIDGQVSSASDLIDARMDAARNKFLLASVCMSIASISLTILTCVGGIFGMNLASGLEDITDPPYFNIVTLVSCVGSVVVAITLFGIMVKLGVITGLGPVDQVTMDALS